MEDSSVNDKEPAPPPEMTEAQAVFQEQVDEFSHMLMRKLQLAGGFNPVELECRLFILTEQLNLLTKILQTETNGNPAYSDLRLTEQMTKQMAVLTKTMGDALDKAPRIDLAGARRMNGAKHN